MQQKLGTITNLQYPYLRTTSNFNLSPTQSPNIKILFKHVFSLSVSIAPIFATLFYSVSLIHLSHFTCLTHLGNLYQCSQFVCEHLFLLSLTCIDFRSIFFSQGISLLTTASYTTHTNWNGLLTNHLLG